MLLCGRIWLGGYGVVAGSAEGYSVGYLVLANLAAPARVRVFISATQSLGDSGSQGHRAAHLDPITVALDACLACCMLHADLIVSFAERL